MYKPTCPREQAIFLLLDIQENETVMKGRKTFKGNAKLQRIIEYLTKEEGGKGSESDHN